MKPFSIEGAAQDLWHQSASLKIYSLDIGMTNTYLLVCCIENAIGLSELNGRVGVQTECNFSFFLLGEGQGQGLI